MKYSGHVGYVFGIAAQILMLSLLAVILVWVGGRQSNMTESEVGNMTFVEGFVETWRDLAEGILFCVEWVSKEVL